MTFSIANLQPIVALIAGVLILHHAAASEFHCRDLSDRHRHPWARHFALSVR